MRGISRVTILLLWSNVQDFGKQPTFLRLECTGEISGLYNFQSKKKSKQLFFLYISYSCYGSLINFPKYLFTANFAE